jgi:hypothetical protein
MFATVYVKARKARYAKAIIPILGANLLTDGGFETWVSATNLTNWVEAIAGSSSVNREGTDKVSGNYAVRLDVDGSNSNVAISQAITGWNAGIWAQLSFQGKSSPTARSFVATSGTYSITTAAMTTSYQPITTCLRSVGTNDSIVMKRSVASTLLYADDATFQLINFPSCLKTIRYTTGGDFIIRQKLRVIKGTQIGFGVNLDSASNPQNGVFVYADGSNVRIELLKAGVWSSVLSTGASWPDDNEMQFVKSGTSYSVYRAGAQLGTTQTINEPTINNNTIHMQFSTYGGNLFTSPFLCYDNNPKNFTFLGDSISVPVSTWATVFLSNYNHGIGPYHNWAVSGAHVMSDYAENMTKQTGQAASDAAQVIFILLGTNDSVQDDTFRAMYQTNLSALKTSNPTATIYALGILASTGDRGQATKNPLIQTACANVSVTYWDTTNWINPATDTDDGLHPNDAGKVKIASQVFSRV